MAQAKVTDYYSRRKTNSALKPTKRSARNLKLKSSAVELTPAAAKLSKLTADFPETLPVKTAAFGAAPARSELRLGNNEVDLTSQLQAFNKSRSSRSSRSSKQKNESCEPNDKVGDTLKKAANLLKSDLVSQSSSIKPTERLTEKTPVKRQASEPGKEEPPRRKRTKLSSQQSRDEDVSNNAITRTPSRTKKPSSVAVKVRRRLDNQDEGKTETSKPNTKIAGRSTILQDAGGKLDASEMREKLAGCGKLADLQARLALVKGTAAEIKKLRQQTAIKPPVPKLEEKPSEPAPVPAFERYRHLIQPGPSALNLPFKYRSLEEVFRCSDTVVSMLHNRTELCTFSKLKHGVQEMSRRTFELDHLKKIKSVYPTAYDLQWSKTAPQMKTNSQKKEPYTLLVDANLAGIPTDPSSDKLEKKDSGNLMKSLMQPSSSQSGSSMFEKFTPSMLIARRTLFHNGLVDIVKTHHKDYLSKLDPPIAPIPDEKLYRWHPKFPLDKIPDVQPSDIPMPQKAATFNTAKDVLDKARQMMVNPKVTKALEMVAKNSELKAAVEAKRAAEAEKKTKTAAPPAPKANKALKGVSQDLLSRIKAKEAQKAQLTMMRTPEEESRIGMLERLPDLCRILRVFFLAEKKAALPVDVLAQKLIESYRSALSKDDVEKHINLMIEVLPDWLKKVHIRKVCYIKMDKTKDLAVIIEVINARLKEAKKIK